MHTCVSVHVILLWSLSIIWLYLPRFYLKKNVKTDIAIFSPHIKSVIVNDNLRRCYGCCAVIHLSNVNHKCNVIRLKITRKKPHKNIWLFRYMFSLFISHAGLLSSCSIHYIKDALLHVHVPKKNIGIKWENEQMCKSLQPVLEKARG